MNEVKFAVGAATDVGKERSVNEDCHGFARTSIGDLYVVCDGMGGHSAGDVASRVATDAIIQQVLSADPSAPVSGVLSQAILAAHEAVLAAAAADPGRTGMGTTCVVALVQGNHCTVGNVGDSRAYLIRAEQASLISTDHTRAQEMVAHGIITQEDVANHPEQGVLSQALGQKKELSPAISDLVLGVGDTVLLCSDGVYDCLSDAQVAELAGVRNPHYAAGNIVAYSTEHDGKDNATAIVFRHMEASAAPAAAPPSAAQQRATLIDEPVTPPSSGVPKALLIAVVAALLGGGVVWGLDLLPRSGQPSEGEGVEEGSNEEPSGTSEAAPPPADASTDGPKDQVSAPKKPEPKAEIPAEAAVSASADITCISHGDCAEKMPCHKKAKCKKVEGKSEKICVGEGKRKPDCCADNSECRVLGYKKCDLNVHRCDKTTCVNDKVCRSRGYKRCDKASGSCKGRLPKKKKKAGGAQSPPASTTGATPAAGAAPSKPAAPAAGGAPAPTQRSATPPAPKSGNAPASRPSQPAGGPPKKSKTERDLEEIERGSKRKLGTKTRAGE